MNLWMGLLTVLVSTAAATAAMLATRRLAPARGFYANPGTSASVVGVLGTAFAVILAFVILLALQSYNNARQTRRAGSGSRHAALPHERAVACACSVDGAGRTRLLRP